MPAPQREQRISAPPAPRVRSEDGGGWLREEQDESREFVPEGAVIFEMAFGRRPGTPGAEAP